MHSALRLIGLVATAALVAASCGSDEDPAATSTAPDGTTSTTVATDPVVPIVFSGQGNDLVAYEGVPPFTSQVVIANNETDPENGLDINAQICFWTDDAGTQYFIAGEDTHQPDPPAGWGIFELTGDQVGDLAATQVGKLTPTFQEGEEPENYGCGMLSDGRLLTTDVGNQALGAGTGQLIVWFPPFDSFDVAYCKIDVEIATAQSIWVDDHDDVWVASSRPGTGENRGSGVWKYHAPFPTGPTEDEGCGSTDATGAPMADVVDRELVVVPGDPGMLSPAGVAPTPQGTIYVSSVATGVINEYDLEGTFVRQLLAPPEGELLDDDSYSTGTPLGIGVGPDGSIYYADIGVICLPGGEDGCGQYIGPGPSIGNVRRIAFDEAGEPLPPDTMDSGLPFPDGIGIWTPGASGGVGGARPIP